jgi:acetyl-CoA carboxylase biotin carboxyl carrier protein
VFYRASSPGAPPFVAEGDEISSGQQIAIIEAMKLMLPVEADKGGRIAEVLVGDGDAVEYGQPLFRLAAADEELADAA